MNRKNHRHTYLFACPQSQMAAWSRMSMNHIRRYKTLYCSLLGFIVPISDWLCVYSIYNQTL